MCILRDTMPELAITKPGNTVGRVCDYFFLLFGYLYNLLYFSAAQHSKDHSQDHHVLLRLAVSWLQRAGSAYLEQQGLRTAGLRVEHPWRHCSRLYIPRNLHCGNNSTDFSFSFTEAYLFSLSLCLLFFLSCFILNTENSKSKCRLKRKKSNRLTHVP